MPRNPTLARLATQAMSGKMVHLFATQCTRVGLNNGGTYSQSDGDPNSVIGQLQPKAQNLIYRIDSYG